MRYWTYAELRDKVEADLDLEGETFINAGEILGYFNEAIDEVERQLHTLGAQDYFLSRSTLTLVSGQEEYDLPSDIYAMKLRGLVYRNGTNTFPLTRVKDWRKFEEYEYLKSGTTYTNSYGYFITNSVAGSPKILLAPTPLENGAFVKIWYLRNANRLAVDADLMDIPEAANYVMQYVKVRCYEKELHPNLGKAMEDLKQEWADTVATLETMIPDNQNELEMDLRVYNEMS